MTLKRKRSESEFSFASSSTFSSPSRPFASTTMDMEFGATPPTTPSRPESSRNIMAPSHLPRRTMKRFRDGRPSEEIIHQRTLNILYTAQKQQQHPQPHQQLLPQEAAAAAQPEGIMTQQAPHGGKDRQQQASLHSFWKLPPSSAAAAAAAAAGNAAALPPPATHTPASCEDCGLALGAGVDEGGDSTMDIDGGFDGAEGASCGACGKHVCSHCSITSLGEQRRWCLGCAGRRAGVSSSGLVWPAAGVGVC